MGKISSGKLIIEKLDGSHEISSFKCKIDDLNEFLSEDSMNQMFTKINVTYVLIYESVVVGYFTLSTDAIQLKNINPEAREFLHDKGISYPTLPALKICRLAVQKKYDHQGIGTFIISKIIRQAQDLSEKIGIRFITVDAYLQSLEFYTDRFLFEVFPRPKYQRKIEEYKKNPDENQTDTVPAYLDIHVDVLE